MADWVRLEREWKWEKVVAQLSEEERPKQFRPMYKVQNTKLKGKERWEIFQGRREI